MFRVCILGSNSYIGRILLRELPTFFKENYVFGVSRQDIGDFTDVKNLETYFKNIGSNKEFTIINCAAAGGKTSLGQYSKEELWNNIKIHENIMQLFDYYGEYINIASGAEFDISQPIVDVLPNEYKTILPRDSYGLSKNIIAKNISDSSLGVNLRLFGCFDHIEPSFRLVKTVLNLIDQDKEIAVKNDRYISIISGIDFATLVSQVVNKRTYTALDINCAYPRKIKISELIYHIMSIYKSKVDFSLESEDNGRFEYSCDSSSLVKDYSLPYGLERSLEYYIENYKKEKNR